MLPYRSCLVRTAVFLCVLFLAATMRSFDRYNPPRATSIIKNIAAGGPTDHPSIVGSIKLDTQDQNVEFRVVRFNVAPTQASVAAHTDRTSSNKCDPVETPPRLEMVHIPKTGGSSIEILAARSGISWSRCHWQPNADDDGSVQCPNYTSDNAKFHDTFRVTNWHVPPMYFDKGAAGSSNVTKFNPYRDNTTQLFTIVRNPYDRVVSEFRYYPTWMKRDRWDRRNATHLNQWALQTLRRFRNAEPATNQYFMKDAHMVPQYDFIRGNRHRTWILRQERLAQDFSCLAQVFQMPKSIALNLTHSNRGKGSLSKNNLSQEALQLIEEIYEEDFQKLDYPMFSKEDPGQ